ncbi:glycosyltransferase family 4 protein [Kineosporia babensis]|uniref:Glycosyltransferase family 4 protein n=1 Tax=Kineosporia babensis TaxID=499548 RepID=A0A9X1NF71_9ACTN|nr:glycosyltransferase family 4 protein [Kineosporia babensis]MCD5312720.1 glycosyltransferase family 4 protein [Kineosporia babensis]
MKIAVITTLAGPGSVAGGVWEVVVNQVRSLREAGHEVTLLAGWLGSDPPAELRGLPVRLIQVRPVVKSMGLRFLVGSGWIRAVRETLRGVDLVHVHVCRDYLSLSAVLVAHRSRVPVVAQSHGMLSYPRTLTFLVFDRILTRPALHRVARFITLTDDEAPHLTSFGARDAGSTTVHNTVPFPKATWSPPAGPARLLFASRLHPRKQVMVFARAVLRLRSEGHDVEGIIAGTDQGDLAELRMLCSQSPDGHALRYMGELGRIELDTEFAKATAFVFPARREPYGLVLVEAFSIGTPVVSTTETPLLEVISEAEAARFAEPTVDDFTAVLADLICDRDEQIRLSERGHSLFLDQWTNEVMVRRLTGVYEEVLAERELAVPGRP